MKIPIKRMMTRVLTISLLFLVTGAIAEVNTYNSDNVPKAIPEWGTIQSSLTVPDSFAIADLNVALNIKHTNVADLSITLIAPDGTEVDLYSLVYTNRDDFKDTVFDDEAATSIKDASAPFTGSFQPVGNLAVLDDKDAQGTWKLRIRDRFQMDKGTLKSWSLIIEDSTPPPPPPPPPPPAESGGIVYDSADVPLVIPDPGSATSILTVPDAQIIADVNVVFSITHPYLSDLSATLSAPDGTQVALFTNLGVGGSNFKDTTLNDETIMAIADGAAPYMEAYQPEGSLADLDGLSAEGDWVLEVTDGSKMDAGKLVCWQLIIDYVPVAICTDITVPANITGVAEVTIADIDCGSYDPDGDDIVLSVDPEGPYAIGETEVTLTVTDESGAAATCTALVTVLPTAYSNKEDAITILADLVNPEDPNDPIQMAIDNIAASLGGDVVWAGSDRIADAQGGEGGALVFELEQAACALLDAADPNQAAALDLLVEADMMIMDAVIASAAFQGNDPNAVAEAKALRNEGCAARKQGDTCTAIAKYGAAWQIAADSLNPMPIKVESPPALDYNQDGVIDHADILDFSRDYLDLLSAPALE